MWQFLHFYFNKTPNSPAAYNLFYFHRKIFGQNIRCSPDQAPVDAEHEKWGGKGQMWYVSLDLTRTNVSSYTYIFTLFTYTIKILYIFTGKYQSRSHFHVTSCLQQKVFFFICCLFNCVWSSLHGHVLCWTYLFMSCKQLHFWMATLKNVCCLAWKC